MTTAVETVPQISVTLTTAAEITQISRDVIDIAAKRGELVLSYPSSKPVVLVEELVRWAKELPPTPPNKRRQ